MKKLFYLMTAVLLLWGCENDTQEQVLPTDKEVEENIIVQIGEIPETLYASMDSEQDEAESRTYLEDKRVLWQNGDAISYFSFNTHNTKYIYTGEDGLSNVELNRDESVSGTLGNLLLKSQAVYPYSEDITVEYDETAGIDKINLSYPTTMKYGVNSFGREANIMVAAGVHNGDTDLYFRNAVGYLVIKLYGTSTNGQPTTVKSITLSSVGGLDKIAGSAVIVADKDEAPVITMADDASTSVTLDCSNDGAGVALGADAEHATEFWFCLPPVTFTDGIKITVTDVYDNSYTQQTTNTVNIVRNEVQPMAALEFESNAPAATRLWYTRSNDSTEPFEFDEDDPPFNAGISRHAWDPEIGKIVIEFDSPLTTIEESAFEDTNIATITMPEGVTTIQESAFEDSDLREITFPGSLTDIEVNAFYDCVHLESVTFLPSPTKTPLNICNMDWDQVWGPFYDSKLTTINLNRELNYVDEDGDSFTASDDDEGIFYHENYRNVGEVRVTLGPQVENIWYKMFNYLPIETLTIPGTVKTIENNVFEGCSALTTLNFEPSVDGSPLTIGYYGGSSDDDSPFYDSPLTTVNLNRELVYTFNNPNETDEGIFGDKSTLVNLTLGEQVKTLSPYMFASSGFTTLDLNKVETIGNHALANTPLTSLTVPGCVKTIDNNVFEGCKQLVDLTFEPSVDGSPLTMGFYDASGDVGPFYDAPLATLDLDREIVYTFGGSAINDTYEGLFGGKSSLTSVTLGEQVKTLSPYMFAGSGFTTLDLNKVETIGNHALTNTPLTSLTVPGCVKTIGNNVFEGCKQLADLTFEPSTTETPLTMGFYDASGDVGPFYNAPLATLDLNREIVYTFGGYTIDNMNEGLFGNKTTLTTVTLGEQVKTLSNHMFANAAFTELVIPGSVNTIGNNVFQGCTKLATLTFEPSANETPLTMGFYDADGDTGPFYDAPLATLDLDREIVYTFGGSTINDKSEGLFGNKTTLTEVTLGEQVKTFSSHMFANTAFTELVVPGSLTLIENDAFLNCKKLQSITFNPSPTNEVLTMGYDTYDGNENLFQDNNALTNLVLNREIKQTMTGIDSDVKGLFGGMPKLTNVTLGEQVKTLAPHMFAGSGITSIDLNKVKTISNSALARNAMTSLTIPGYVNTIGNNVFQGCTQLATLTFEPSSDETPLTMGFYDASDDDGPFFDSPLTTLNLNREIIYTFGGYDISSDNEGLFGGKNNLENVTLGDQVKTLSKRMFAGAGFTSINLNKVETINDYALTNTAINTLTIPGYATTIGNNVFEKCTLLTSLTFKPSPSDTPLTIGYYVGSSDDDGPFYDSPLTTVDLNRELVYTFGTPNEADEGLFGDKSTLINLTLGEQAKTILPFMFANAGIQKNTGSSGSNVINMHQYILKLNYAETIGKNAFMNTGITHLKVYPSVMMIDDKAFMGCASLEEVAIESSNQPITIGFQPGSDQLGPFFQSPLTNIVVHRNLKMTDAYESACDDDDEGIFSTAHDILPTTVTLGGQISELPKYVFAGLDIESISIPQVVNKINGWAFYNCKKLSTVRFESGTTPLTIGAQIGTSDSGPFWQSPLSNIYINRELVMDEEYAEYCNQSDEGVFSNEYYDDDELPVTNLIIGNNMKTILPYMFASTRIQQLHIPESIDKVCKNVVEENKVLNAIIFYDNAVRPEVEYGAFGEVGLFYEPPGDWQYFIFVPKGRGHLGAWRGELYFTTDDLMASNYWNDIHGIMIDSEHTEPHNPLSLDGRTYWTRYFDVEGYEWYKDRYFNDVMITPPTE